MAKPTVNTTYPMDQHSYPFQPQQWQNRLEDIVPDSAYTTRTGHTKEYVTPMPGALRYECGIIGRGAYKNIYAHGGCYFKWLLNRSGGDLAQFSFASRPANTSGSVASATGTVSTIVDTGLTVDEITHSLISILDDAAGSNADPEGDWAIAVANIATRIDLQPDLSAVTVVSDTYDIAYMHEIEASADGDEAVYAQGTIVSPDGIPDDYWGWVGCWGITGTALKTGSVVAGDAVVADAGIVGPSGSDPINLHVGWSVFVYQEVYTKAAIFVNALFPVADAAS